MLRQLLKSKIHRATVTEVNVDYEGSIIIDETLMQEAKIVEWEKVLIANLSNGARVETYAIKGKAGSGTICANGGAALHCRVGDKVLIMSFCVLDDEQIAIHRPKIVKVDERNRVLR